MQVKILTEVQERLEAEAAARKEHDTRTGIEEIRPGVFIFVVNGRLKAQGTYDQCLSRMKRKKVRASQRL